MKTRNLIVIFTTMMLFSAGASAGSVTGGEDVEPVIEETIFSAIEHSTNTADGDDWEFAATLNQEAASNNTTFTLTVQQCNNDGVCLPPTIVDTTTSDNLSFNAAIATIDDHSYVNWRVQATYHDDNDSTEKFPAAGWFKAWSNCWFHDGEWGGDGCDDVDGQESVPAIGVIATTAALTIAAIIRRE